MAFPKQKLEGLVMAVDSYPWLYTPSHQSYKDVGKRNNSWEDIAAKLDPEGRIAAKTAAGVWRQLRDRYMRIRKSKGGQLPSGSSREAADAKAAATKWWLYPMLDNMLARHAQHRRGGDSFDLGRSGSSEESQDVTSQSSQDETQQLLSQATSLTETDIIIECPSQMLQDGVYAPADDHTYQRAAAGASRQELASDEDDCAPGTGSDRMEAATASSSSGSSASISRRPSGDSSTGAPESGVQPETPTTPGGGVSSRGRKRPKKDTVSAFEEEVLKCFKSAKEATRQDSQPLDECDYFGREAACALRRLDGEKRLKCEIGF